MKPKIIHLFLTGSFLSGALLQCKPEVEKPAIENCLISKIDALDVNPITVNNQPAVSIDATSTVFEYDKSNQPIKFLYYSNSLLNSYTTVTYNSDGTLDKGQNYDNNDYKTGTDEYIYDSNKQLIEIDNYDDTLALIGYTVYEYDNASGLPSLSTNVAYDSYYDELNGRIFRYEYDSHNNLVKRFSRYWNQAWDYNDPNFLDTFVSELKAANEVLNISLTDYDDKFNPYRAQPSLAALFDNLPAYNNARSITYYYVDSGDKYADLTYSYEYNRKGFPYIYNVAVNYTTEYTNSTGIDDYTETSSYEYLCK